MNTLPFANIPYRNINSIGKQWIRRFALSLSKETLGQVRGKFGGNVPIPGDNVTLNASDLLSQAQAEQQALNQLTAQQGLGTFQSQLGAQQRQIAQAELAADQEAAREAAFGDYTRLGLIGPQLASVIGGFPAATQVQSTPPPSTTQQLLGLGIGAAGLAGAARGLFGPQ